MRTLYTVSGLGDMVVVVIPITLTQLQNLRCWTCTARPIRTRRVARKWNCRRLKCPAILSRIRLDMALLKGGFMKYVSLALVASIGAIVWLKVSPIAALLLIAVALLWTVAQELKAIRHLLSITAEGPSTREKK